MIEVPPALENEAYLRWRWDPGAVHDHILRGDAIGWTRITEKGERWATAFGRPEEVVNVLIELDRAAPLDGITCARNSASSVMDRWPAPDPGAWSLWEFVEGEGRRCGDVEALAVHDPRIDGLLEFSSSAHVFTGHPDIVRWLGVPHGDRLVAVAGHMRGPRDSAHVVSVCTHPDARGRGLAGTVLLDLVARAKQDQVAGVYLETYTDNVSAAAVYSRVGFRETGRYLSWVIGDRNRD